MMKNKSVFFATINPSVFNRHMKTRQVADIEEILSAFDRHGVTDLEERAYMLATTKWETDHTMHPISEHGFGKGKKYGKKDPKTGHIYYGRGYVQLTWLKNYRKMGKLLGIDLVNAPSLALVPRHAADILVLGMRDGLFDTKWGVKLSRYLGFKRDWLGARRTVNGTDKAAEIAAIAIKFNDALHQADEATPMVVIERRGRTKVSPPKQVTIASLIKAFFRTMFSWS